MENVTQTLSAVIPAYNEEKNLKSAVESTAQTLDFLGLDYEIIIVNDYSTDATAEIAEALAASSPQVRCLHHPRNLGCGGAFRTGIRAAAKDYVVFVPADNPLLPEDMEAYLPRMGTCDIIVGVRAERTGYSPVMRFSSFVYNRLLIPLLFNIGLSDVNWIQIYKSRIFREDGITIEYDGIFFLVEILVKAKRQRLIIAEVPAKMKKRIHGKPTNAKPSVIWQTFRDMIGFFWRINCRGPQPLPTSGKDSPAP